MDQGPGNIQGMARTSEKSKYLVIELPANHDETIGYHSACYSTFTAFQKQKSEAAECMEPSMSSPAFTCTLRSKIEELPPSSSGILPQTCLFCNHATVSNANTGKKEYLGSCEMDSAETNIRDAARILGDDIMLCKISGIDMIAKEARYHHSCKSKYLTRSANMIRKQKTEKSEKLQSHEEAFSKLLKYIDTNIIKCVGSTFLTDLHSLYLDWLDEGNDSTYTSQMLSDKIMKAYPDILKKHTISKKSGVILYHADLSTEAAINRAKNDTADKECAIHLRSEVLNLQKTQGDDDILAKISADDQRPETLIQFLRVLYTGSSAPASEKVERLIKSAADDMIYAISHGRIKPSKHVCLALGMKSLTGSRKLIEALNRFGHCLSYHTAEEIETGLAEDIIQKDEVTPDGLQKKKGLCTGLAWDNYDEMNETLSGRGTLHDTVGICYQNEIEEIEPMEIRENVDFNRNPSEPEKKTIDKAGKKRRTLEIKEQEIEPYHKKPKMNTFDYNVREPTIPSNLEKIKYRDIFWMMSLSSLKVPMWTGWNSLVTVDLLPSQRIAYMKNLNLPPTRLDVVAETLNISQRVAKECGDKYAVVTYDLAVAKPALQIQAEEKPRYDDVFVCFGAFHIFLAFFGSLGHIIDSSGGPHLLTETEVLAPGSLNGFILGKHYNRYEISRIVV